MEEWEGYFKEMLGGVDWRVRGKGERRKKEEEEEEELSREEMEGAIRRLKDRKAAGGDGIVNEAWKYGGEEVRSWLWEICKRVWKGEDWPKEWWEGVIVPIWKKGKGKKAEDYRGITLTQTAYKIYAMMVENRLRKEVEYKRMLPPSQAGFREGRGTVGQIYGLNYMINKKIEEKDGKMVVMFMDLKAAFDSVNREILVESMRKRGVSEGLIERSEEILRETECK
ncbi:PREDICTED: uncharacterized protein LOC105567363, partial [Vollenhovia emeryi]|uniref:uncharacterized protein LOC105567363 n=1 Tax=Vollenhovia emeryi TaxID=411798 RepID=UPI0005F4C62B